LRKGGVFLLRKEEIFDIIVESLSGLKEVLAVIVFGSFARGDYGPRSDIDLFIVTENKEIKNAVEDKILGIGIEREIRPVIRSKKELEITDPGLFKNVFIEGRILHLKKNIDLPVSLLLSLKPYKIIMFNLKNLGQKEKIRFNSALYGVKKKNYVYKGILEMYNCEKIGAGCILIPAESYSKIKDFFESYRLEWNEKDVWL
jgi:predicted nucleotidyltransferase